jgi:RNA polymerase sigma-B factor
VTVDTSTDPLVDLDRRTRLILQEASDSPPDRTRLREQAVEMNMPFARAIAMPFRGKGIEWDDLVQVAYLALTKAVAGFDAGMDFRFSAYATATIRGELKRWFRDHDWMIRAPRRLQDLRLAAVKRAPAVAQSLQRDPSSADVATVLEVAVADVDAALLASRARRSLSLDAPVHDHPGVTLGDAVADPIDGMDAVEWRLCLSRSLARLSPRARLILRLRFESEATQSEIGKVLGISQMHVSRLLAKLLDQLRRDLEVAA